MDVRSPTKLLPHDSARLTKIKIARYSSTSTNTDLFIFEIDEQI